MKQRSSTLLARCGVVIGMLAACSFAPAAAQPAGQQTFQLDFAAGGWALTVNSDGTFRRLEMTFDKKRVNVPWRSGAKDTSGPSWAGVKKSIAPDLYLTEGKP